MDYSLTSSLGHSPVVAVEWEPYACQSLREQTANGWFPDLRVWEGDVQLFDPSEYTGRVDCIHAGFPCQDISVAGAGAGIGEETRSGLYREVLRIAGVVRPRDIFLENVSAILTRGLGVVLGDLSALGYTARWICLRASDVGAHHHRDRWWLLARKMATRTIERAPNGKLEMVTAKRSEQESAMSAKERGHVQRGRRSAKCLQRLQARESAAETTQADSVPEKRAREESDLTTL